MAYYLAWSHCGHHWVQYWGCTLCPAWQRCDVSSQSRRSCLGWTCRWPPLQSCNGTLLSWEGESGVYRHVLPKSSSNVTPTVYSWDFLEGERVPGEGRLEQNPNDCNSKLRNDPALTVAETSLSGFLWQRHTVWFMLPRWKKESAVLYEEITSPDPLLNMRDRIQQTHTFIMNTVKEILNKFWSCAWH